MGIYVENLYDNIFCKVANKYTYLRVISGYASASFLSRVANDFPHLKIELFIGMTSEGLSKKNHLEFQSIMKKNSNISVFYQIQGKPNHMKIIEFSVDTTFNKKTFVGSANFSENGFFNNKEIMTHVESLPEVLFDEQIKNSLLCLDEKVTNYIEIYENENTKLDLTNSSKNEIINNDSPAGNATNKQSKSLKNNGSKKTEQNWRFLWSKIDPKYYDSFEITVVLPKENNARWANKGINAWVEQRAPVLEHTPKLLFTKVFPKDEEFIIYTDDGKKLKAKLTGNFKGQLKILNLNLYDYIRKRIGLLEERPISYDDLEAKGYTIMYFTRINQNEYTMSFNKDYWLNFES